MTPCRCDRRRRADRWGHRLLAAALGVLLGVLLSLFVVADAASRSAAQLGAPDASASGQVGQQSGTPLDLASVPAAATGDARPVGTPQPTATVDGPPAPSANRRLTAPKLVGVASYMAPSYGRRYLALPAGPGVRVRVCGAADCIVRTSTDAGPDREMQRQGRIVDLSWWDWITVSGLSPARGLAPVSVEVLRP